MHLSEIANGGKTTTRNLVGSEVKNMWFSVLREHRIRVIWLDVGIHWQRSILLKIVSWVMQLG